MSKLASIVLNWIGGGKTPIPIRFLKSVDIPGNAPTPAPTPQSETHILEVLGSTYESDLDTGLALLKLDGNTVTDITELQIITPLNTIIKYQGNLYGINYVYLGFLPYIEISSGCTYKYGSHGEYDAEKQIFIRYQDDELFYIEIFDTI